MNTKLRALGILASLAIAVSACGGTSTSPGAGSAAPSAGASGAAASTAPLTGKLTIWHAYGSSGGNAEFTAFSKIVDNLKAANPGLTVELLEVPFGDMFTKFKTELAAGGGPDLLIAPNDSLGDQVRAGFLADVTGKIDDVISQSTKISVDGSTIDGKLYEVPESVKAVAMYYDSKKVTSVPKNTDELLSFVKGGGKLGVLSGPYFGWGFYNGFGGKILDDSGKCAATTGTGIADAIKYVADLKAAGATVNADYDVVNNAFKNGDVDIILNGNWVLADYKAARPDVAVGPVPAGPAGASATMVGVDGWYINATSANIDTAIAAAKFMVSPASQQIYVDGAGHAPANTTVSATDPLVTSFVEAINTGQPRPQTKEFGNYWSAFDNAWKEILDKGTDPATAITAACATMDQANGK
jgi:arabinogalactan oligomer/maltooligosaccharide transport system substrate-binding protein